MASLETMPRVGFGTALIPEKKLLAILLAAIERGVRLFDTAEGYMNEYIPHRQRVGGVLSLCVTQL